jgi:drug/metabolite transporter (DMT)-like permease
VTGIYGNQLLFTVGLSKTSADVASIFQPAIPVFAALVAMISGLEPPIWPKALNEVGNYTMRKILGILLAVLGSMIMVGFSNLSHGQGIVGDLCLVGNTFCFGVYFCLQKPLLSRYGPLTVTAYAYISGAFCMLLTSLQFVSDSSGGTVGTSVGYSVWSIKRMEVYGLVYAWLGSDGINGVMMTWCNQYIPASICALYNMMQPITTSILAYIILKEGLVMRDAYGGVLIIFGLCLCSLKV